MIQYLYENSMLALSQMAHFICICGLVDLKWPLSARLLGPQDCRVFHLSF